MQDDIILKIQDLEAGYGDVQILHGVNIVVPRNQIVTIVGPNGAGKSTIMKAIYKVASVTSGAIVLNQSDHEIDVLKYPAHKLSSVGISHVPQVDNVFPTLTIDENLDVGLPDSTKIDIGAKKDEMYQRYPDLLPRRREKAGALSGGQRQMLALARALMSGPTLLLLDEPSAGLAPALVDQLFDELVRIVSSGVTILMVEQNARRALEISHYGYVLEMGKNRHEGQGRVLADDPEIVGIYFGNK